MREIKFRGLNEKTKWYFGDFITDAREYNRTCNRAYILPHWETLNGPIMVIRETVGEFTGLKDKNGVEIYEDDITLRNGIKYRITKEIGSFMLVKCNENTDMYKEFTDCWNDHVYPLSQLYWNNDDEENQLSDLEVIGNVHENQKLLEVAE